MTENSFMMYWRHLGTHVSLLFYSELNEVRGSYV